MNEYTLALDLAKAKQRQQQTIFLRQGDKNATTIVATITDHGVAASTSGMTARFQMRLPNSTEYYRKTATLSGNVATVTIDEAQAASAVGRTDVAYFQLLQGSMVVASTESFTIVVLPDALADATVPESYDSAIQDAIDALDAAVENMSATVEDVLAAHPEWTTTVQDGSITKDKLATDLARDRERLLYRLANMLTNALPEGETATATDAAQTPMAGLALYGRSTQDGTPTPSAPVAIVSVAAANLLPNAASTQTVNGLTFTVNADGSITVTGTATARTDFVLASGITFAAGTYTISGAPQSTGTGDWNLRVDMAEQPKTNYVFDNGYTSGNNRTNAIPAGVAVDAIIRVYAGKSPNATFYPMLNAGSTATYPYVPYGNVGLWAKGRNLLDQNDLPATNTTSGITFTNNGDGSFGTSGTATAARSINLYSAEKYASVFKSGGKFSLAVFGVSVSGATFNLSLPYTTPGSSTERYLSPNNSPQEIPAGSTAKSVRLYVPSGTTVQQTSAVRAMLVREDSIPTTYVPYTATVTSIDLDGHELRSLPDGTRDELTVGADGHAVLVQRVGSVTYDGTESWTTATVSGTQVYRLTSQASRTGWDTSATGQRQRLCNMLAVVASDPTLASTAGTFRSLTHLSVNWDGANNDLAAFKAALAANPLEIVYLLATPVTHDLGYVAAVPLCGPDLTAQAIPTAPMQLTYERDLNVTLARLESAIATLA